MSNVSEPVLAAQTGRLQNDDDQLSVVLTRAQVVKQIEARLSDVIDDEALAAWAFDRFYAEEMGSIDFEPEAEPAIADALDELMFGDDPSFRLDERELQNLVARLSV
jgi:hypothetical protein